MWTRRRFLKSLPAPILGSVFASRKASAAQAGASLRIDTPMAPPRWAVLERQLLADNVPACREFYEKYFDERGYLQCFVRWGANDGPDDAFENFNRWPELHALGADDEILQMYLEGPRRPDQAIHRGADHRRADRPAGHVLQGIHRPVRLDAPRRRAAALQPDGAFDPGAMRTTRSARGGSPDSTWARIPRRRTTIRAHSIIRSMQNGSRGPMLRKATALDWVGDPFDVKALRRRARRIDVRAVPRALRGIHRRRRRSLSQPGRDDAADERVSARRRGQVQDVARRVHGRLARSDEAQRRRHSQLRRSRTARSADRRASGGATPTAGDSARSIR